MQEQKTEEIKFLLKDLNCANCAAKIQNKIKDLKEVSDANIDIISSTLTVKVSKAGTGEIAENVSRIVKTYEPDVEVIRLDKSKPTVKIGVVDKKGLVKLILSITCFFIAVVFNLPYYVKYSLLIISYILSGAEVIIKAYKNIRQGQVFDENFLMTIATLGAIAIKQYPEAAAVMLFYSVGEFFQDLSVNRSRKSILALMDIKSDYANLKTGDKIEKVSPDKVMPGDIILVKPGERVPLDGVVIKGRSSVDTSALTGEPVPRDVGVSDQVLSGFINKSGVLIVEVSKVFEESTVSKILSLVQNASSRKSTTENFITKFAKIYTPVVVGLAIILAFVVPSLLAESYSKWIYRSLVFLVVSCPCALVLSVPLSFFTGIGLASKKGILIKGTNFLEALSYVDAVVFDKTGTLTKGVFKVTEVNAAAGFSSELLLKYAAYAEAFSNHPIAASIVVAYGQGISKEYSRNYSEIPGLGVSAEVFGKKIIIGNIRMLEKYNLDHKSFEDAGTRVYVAIDRVYAGYIVISDEVKEDSKYSIEELKKLGIKNIIMLTGDVKKSACSIAEELSIGEYYYGLLPNEKVYELEKIQYKNKKTVFVGDGINDAPVLARADVGIAMGALGSDAAVEAADVVIMTDEPSKVAKCIQIAKRTKRIVWQNITFIMAVKAIVLILGALGAATIWAAVFADVGVTIIAVLNSLRIYKL
jgi:Cd2+/Zn2+-exporting ATPase